MVNYIKENIRLWIFICLFTLISVLVRGYEFGGGNQVHYFNYAFYTQYPGMYPDDYLFHLHSVSFTVFIPFLVMILQFFGESQLIFFCIYSSFTFIVYLTLYRISATLFHKPLISAFILLLFIVPIPIGGTTIYSIERSLTPRLIAEMFLLAAMYSLLRKKEWVSSIFSGVGFLFHPITILPFVPILFLTKYFGSRTSARGKGVYRALVDTFRAAWVPVGLFLLVASPILRSYAFSGQHAPLFIDAKWREVILERLPYLFIWRWSWFNFVLLGGLWYIYFRNRTTVLLSKYPLLKAIALTTAAFFFISVVSAAANFRIGTQLQLARNLYLFIVFMLIAGTGSILKRFADKRIKQIGVLVCIAVLAVSIPGRQKFGILWMNPYSDYQKAALWANTYSTVDSIFAVPLSEEAFRFWSKRAVFVENKDGGDGLYDRNLALAWDVREDLIEEDTFSDMLISRIKHDFGVRYLVTKQKLPYPAVYANATWTIYEP